MKIRPMGSELFACGRTDRHDEANFANATKKKAEAENSPFSIHHTLYAVTVKPYV